MRDEEEDNDVGGDGNDARVLKSQVVWGSLEPRFNFSQVGGFSEKNLILDHLSVLGLTYMSLFPPHLITITPHHHQANHTTPHRSCLLWQAQRGASETTSSSLNYGTNHLCISKTRCVWCGVICGVVCVVWWDMWCGVCGVV